MRRILLGAVVLVVAVVALVAFRSGSGSSVVQTPEGAVLISGSNDENGDAAIEGTLEIAPAGCLGARGEDGSLQVLVLPAGTTVSTDEPLKVVFQDQRLSLGDTFFGGGQEVGWDPSDYPLPADAPESCRGASVFLLSNIEAR